MLDLIEHTNRDVVILMSLAFSIGFIFSIVLCYMPVRTKLDTYLRNQERTARDNRAALRREGHEALLRRSARAGEYRDYPLNS